MFGITAGQNSVSMHVHNFTPYFYVKVNTAAMPKPLGPDDLQGIKDQLNKWVTNSTNQNEMGGVAI